MKKFATLAFALVFTLCLTSCGGTKTNEITDLLDKGLVVTQTSSTEESFKAIIQSEEGFDEIYVVEADMNSSQYNAFNELDPAADDYADQQKKILGTLENVKVTDAKDKLPTEEYLNSYKGKTVAVLEKDGYDNTGYTLDDGTWTFCYDGPKYCLELTVKGDAKSVDDLSPNAMRKFVIEKVKFVGLSGMFLDEI